MFKLSARLLRPVSVYRYFATTIQFERGRRSNGDSGFSSRRSRNKIEDLIIEEETHAELKPDFYQIDNNHGSSDENRESDGPSIGDYSILEDWKNENQVDILTSSRFLEGSIPPPVTEFDQLSEMIPSNVFRMVKKSGYEKPTAIQSIGIPIGLNGINMVGVSRTGSGKTLSFLIPAIDHIISKKMNTNDESSYSTNSPTAIVVLPTRELCQQVQQVAQSYLQPLGLSSVAIYGGADKHHQIRKIRNGIDLVVATPGRLLDLMGRRNDSQHISLENTSFVTLDEADRMLDMGFESDVREIIFSVEKERQLLMYSATWPNEIQRLAKDFLGSEYIRINVGSSKLSANANVIQNVRVVYDQSRYGKLKELINILNGIFASSTNTKTLIFVNTKREADFLAGGLRKSGVNAQSIHGGVSQDRRDSIYKSFKNSSNSMLVATDVAARGLDVTDINFVINYDFPQQDIENYVHRIGRTCRGSNTNGTAYTLLTPQDRHIPQLIEFIEDAGQEVPSEVRDLAFGGNRGRHPR